MTHFNVNWQTQFDAPKGSNPVALNLGSMGKGEAWINGQSIGRYWVSFHTAEGYPSQTWYEHCTISAYLVLFWEYFMSTIF